VINEPITTRHIPELAERPSAADEADILAAAPLSGRRRFLRRFKSNRGAMIAFGFIALLIVIAIIGPWITPHDPNKQSLANRLADPRSPDHLLGTDALGRDVLSRLIVGTRVAMLAAGQAVSVALLLGVPPGLIAGYFGGRIDLTVMRITDAVQAFPPLILAIAMVGILGRGLFYAMLAVGIVFAPNFLRIVRGAVLEVREETFIEASRSIGTPTLRIVRTRILPNVLPPLLVQVSLAAGFALLAEAGLSFLGLGVQPPQASWGLMLGQGYDKFSQQPWLIVIPGIAIALTVLSFNVIGDGLRDSIGRETRRER
jgi:peptide/nickel transport system permease protein